MAAYGCQTYVGLGRTPIPNGPAVTPAPVSIIKNHMWRQYRPGRLLHHCAAMRALLCASLKAGKVALLSGRVGPTCRSRFAPMGPTLCARLDDPYGSPNARVWPQGGTFGRAWPPLRRPGDGWGCSAIAVLPTCRSGAAAGMLPWARNSCPSC